MKKHCKSKRTVPAQKSPSARGKLARFLVKGVFTSLTIADKALKLLDRLFSFWRD